MHEGEDVVRAAVLAQRIVAWVRYTVSEYGLEVCRIGIELPVVAIKRGPGGRVLGMNVETYKKQVRLLQMVEAFLIFNVASMCELEVAEFGNATSKKLLTGNGQADKNEMLAAGPFTKMKPVGRAKTLTDAYAHALSANAGQHTNYTALVPQIFPERQNEQT